MKSRIQTTCKKICDRLSTRKMAWATELLFVLLLLPVCYLSFINRASGDDYGYGAYTRAAWQGSHSLLLLGTAIRQTVRQYYYGWQGTWFSVAVFSLQPEVFSDHAYVITAFLMLFLWIGSTALLFKELLHRRMGLNKESCGLITMVFLILAIQFIPSTKSSIFWFNGTVHYMLPFAMCQLLFYLLLHYGGAYPKRTLAGITLLMALLGGSNYQAALFALILAVYMGIVDWYGRRDKRIFRLAFPVLLEAAGLLVSMKAPGNKVRGGEGFGFSVKRGIFAIGNSFLCGFRDIIGYIVDKPLIFVGLGILVLVALEAMLRCEHREKYLALFGFSHPGITILSLICLYSAMQTPALYAGVDVSGGVYNMNYLVFLLTFGGILLVLCGRLTAKQRITGASFHRKAVIPGLLAGLLLAVAFRGNIKESTFWNCFTYITSGQAADYKEQMDLQTRLLEDKGTKDVVLPFMNDQQGPLMHMPAVDDPEAWTNRVMALFYEKNSVMAMPRPEWIRQYGEAKEV